MSTDRKVRSEWTDSLGALKTFSTEHGTLPAAQQDRKLHDWVRRQRWLYKNGKLGTAKEAMLQEIPGVFHFGAPLVDQLAEYVTVNGRLPGSTAADPAERTLGRYLVFSLRPAAKRGCISEVTLAKAEQIPGALTGVRRPNQDEVLTEVREFAAEHGHIPSQTGTGVERRLGVWVVNTLKGDREKKTPAQQQRHDALAELLATVPGRRRYSDLARIRTIEKECAANGWKPSGVDGWLIGQSGRTTDEVLQARIRKILEHPVQRDYRWRQDLALVIEFAARTGHLPSGWHEGHVYSWLATQRRDHRSGALAKWKTDLLEDVPNALAKVRRRAA